jgi:uncharacterized membrane protein
VQGLVKVLAGVLPPDIHPMVVHFPIALLYLTSGAELLALLTGSALRDRFWDRVAFWLLTLSGAAIVAAGAAGVISEQSARFTPTTAALLSAHQRDAVLTGLFALMAWILQLLAQFPRRVPAGLEGWSVLGTRRGRVTWAVLVFGVAATVMVSVTGTLGGSMVYQHCVGVPATSCRTSSPATR